ncbi:hypothetical protein NIES4074_62760 (plasmid) [Cylindrospermum sp. NIES-4074]|nr:hypothetical protein NIES4074_62760 [Cylindrospermum sp. NIES-4074]
MSKRSTNTNQLLSIKECRELLNIQSRDTINEYLKTLDLFGLKHLTWDELRRVLELQIYLGLRHGYNSKDMFRKLSQEKITETFTEYGIDISIKMERIKQKYAKNLIHKYSVQQKGVIVVGLLKKMNC